MTIDHKQAKKRLQEQGISVQKFANQHGFNASTVRGVLEGKVKGNHGESHRIAVALGIKPPPSTSLGDLPPGIQDLLRSRTKNSDPSEK